MGYGTAPILTLLDDVSGGKVTGLMATIESLKGANKSQAGTIKALEGELADARSSRAFAVLALLDVGKSSKEISETLKLDLSEVNRILGNGRG